MFAMNAGMHESDLRPVGLLIECGKQLSKVNIGDGVGNFYWKPNGIFFVGKRNVGIRTTHLYLAGPPEVDYATQSGPMLVLNGAIDGQMLASTSSRNIRNAVGVQDEHTAIFAISDDPVSFSEFARLFRDVLRCSDALYLARWPRL